MWSTEQSIQTTASAEAIWRLWADVAHWPDWIADIERIEISGPFAADSVGPALGPQISRDFPETLASLVDRAQREAGKPGR